jgi:hypothetical protein
MWPIYVNFTLLLGNLFLWIIKFRYLRIELRIVGLALLVTCIFEALAAYLMLNGIRNLFLFHILTPFQYILYTLLFNRTIHNPLLRRITLYSIPLYLLITLLITLSIQKTSEFNSYALLLKNILIACWAIFYYRETFTTPKVSRLEKEPLFWISTGLLFYSLGSFFVDGLMNYMISQSYSLANKVYYVSLWLSYALYITFLIALLYEKRVVNMYK